MGGVIKQQQVIWDSIAAFFYLESVMHHSKYDSINIQGYLKGMKYTRLFIEDWMECCE